MEDKTLFKIIVIISVVSIAMLNKYSNYINDQIPLQEEIITNKVVNGRITNIRETNNSLQIDIDTTITLNIIATKNMLYEDANLTKGDEIIIESDFSNLNEVLEKAYFAKQLILKKSSK